MNTGGGEGGWKDRTRREMDGKVDRRGGQKETWEERVLSPSPKSTDKTIQGMGITNFSTVNPHEIKPTKARKKKRNVVFCTF